MALTLFQLITTWYAASLKRKARPVQSGITSHPHFYNYSNMWWTKTLIAHKSAWGVTNQLKVISMLLSSLSQSHHYKRKSITNRETPQINLANLISSTLILFVDFDYLLTIISLQKALCYFQLIPTTLKHPSPAHPPCKTSCYLYQSPRLHDDSIL